MVSCIDDEYRDRPSGIFEGMIAALDFASPEPGVYALSEHLWNRLRAAPAGSAAARLFARAPDERVGPFRIYRVPAHPNG